MGADVERRGGFLKQFERDAGIDQRAQQHVAADAGKTLEVANSHRGVILNCRLVRCLWSLLKDNCRSFGSVRRGGLRSG